MTLIFKTHHDWLIDLTCEAIKCGELFMLQWWRMNGLTLWDSHWCNLAGTYGHLHILQWLRAHGCPWDHWTCYESIHQLHVLKWLRIQDCPWRVNFVVEKLNIFYESCAWVICNDYDSWLLPQLRGWEIYNELLSETFPLDFPSDLRKTVLSFLHV